MPRQDAQGRWISDDGLQYWDGAAWRPTGAYPPAQKSIAVPVVLMGCGFALVIILVLAIGFGILMGSAGFQRSFCNGYVSSDPNAVCPFHPSSP